MLVLRLIILIILLLIVMLSFRTIKAELLMALMHTHPNSCSSGFPLRIWGHDAETEEIHCLLTLFFSFLLFLIERELCTLQLVSGAFACEEAEYRCLWLLVDQRASRLLLFFPVLRIYFSYKLINFTRAERWQHH